MTRIGKQPIHIPEKTEVDFQDDHVNVKGPRGELSRTVHGDVEISVSEGVVEVKPTSLSLRARALWGTYASHIRNMIEGVNKGFEKRLVIEGVGYRASVSGDVLTLNVGFSHPVEKKIPEGIDVSVEKNTISISGIDKEHVGAFAAEIRAVRKPEPYKGKGIRYEDEVVRRKQGKKAA